MGRIMERFREKRERRREKRTEKRVRRNKNTKEFFQKVGNKLKDTTKKVANKVHEGFDTILYGENDTEKKVRLEQERKDAEQRQVYVNYALYGAIAIAGMFTVYFVLRRR